VAAACPFPLKMAGTGKVRWCWGTDKRDRTQHCTLWKLQKNFPSDLGPGF